MDTSILKVSQGFVILLLALGLVPSYVNTWLLRVLTFLSLVSRKAPGFIFPGAFLLPRTLTLVPVFTFLKQQGLRF